MGWLVGWLEFLHLFILDRPHYVAQAGLEITVLRSSLWDAGIPEINPQAWLTKSKIKRYILNIHMKPRGIKEEPGEHQQDFLLKMKKMKKKS